MSSADHPGVTGGTRPRPATPPEQKAAAGDTGGGYADPVWESLVEADITALIAAAECEAGGHLDVEIEPDVEFTTQPRRHTSR